MTRGEKSRKEFNSRWTEFDNRVRTTGRGGDDGTERECRRHSLTYGDVIVKLRSRKESRRKRE